MAEHTRLAKATGTGWGQTWLAAWGLGLGLGLGLGCAPSDGADETKIPGGGATTEVGPAAQAPSSDGPSIPTFNLGNGGETQGGPRDGGTGADAAPPVDPGPPQGRTLWGLDDSNRLVRFGASAPDRTFTRPLLGLAPGEKLVALDFRPKDRRLYAVSDAKRIYRIDVTGARVTPVSTEPFEPGVMGQASGFDFDPVRDAMRVCTDVDQNLKIDADTGQVRAVWAPLSFAAGDVNFRQSPNLVAAAYTESVWPRPQTSTLFAIDSTRHLLTRVAPQTGQVETVGPLGVSGFRVAGFDIVGSGASVVAYAALRVSDETGLYEIDLATGSATRVGVIGYPAPLVGLAASP